MLRGLYSAASGMQAQSLQQDILADNLANVNTTGFKAARNTYRTFGEEMIKRYSSIDDERGTEMGKLNEGIAVHSTNYEFNQGSLRVTSNPLDIAISGKGFFPIKGNNGQETFYTRNGNFSIDRDGFLVTNQGRQVLDAGLSAIHIGTEGIEDVKVLVNGDLLVNGELQSKLGLFDFPSQNGIIRVTGDMFKPAQQTIQMVFANGSFQQGFVESSNVSPVRASTELINIRRTYEANQRVIQDEVDTLRMLMDIGRI